MPTDGEGSTLGSKPPIFPRTLRLSGDKHPMAGPTYSLVLTAGQAEQLNRVMSIGELAIAEHYRTGWLPSGQRDAVLMQQYLQAMKGAPSLELPFSALREWLRQQERAKP